MPCLTAQDYVELKCPCCSASGALTKYQERTDATQRHVEMGVCLFCTAIVNCTDLLGCGDDTKTKDLQKTSSESFYVVTDEVTQSVPARVNEIGNIIEFALKHLPDDFPRHTFADFGAGMGFMAAAGAKRFGKSYAIEYNTSAMEQLLPHFDCRDSIRVSTDISEIGDRIDLMTIWHTLEHLPDAQAVLGAVRSKLSDSGAIIFQCPMFKSEYVVYTHYFFLNEYACRKMCEKAGFGDVHVWYDMGAEFITCMAMNNAGQHREAPNHPYSYDAMQDQIEAMGGQIETMTDQIEAVRSTVNPNSLVKVARRASRLLGMRQERKPDQ